MKYCVHCGKELMDEAVICPGCGCATGHFGNASMSEDEFVNELSKRMKINGTIWICIACVQILLALFVNWVFGIVGVLNIISAISDLKYSSDVLTNHSGIVSKFEPLSRPIIVLIYNVIFGGIIGVAGSIYYLVGIRSFVMNNRNALSYHN